LGTLPDAPFLRDLLSAVVREANAGVAVNAVGSDVEICERSADASPSARRVILVINHNRIGKWITLSGHLKSLLPGIDLSLTQDAQSAPITQFNLGPQGVAVLVPEQPK